MTKNARLIRSPLYRFADDGVTYTAEAEHRTGDQRHTVRLHLGYPRRRVVAAANGTRRPGERVDDMIMRVARSKVLDLPHQSTCPARREGRHRFYPDGDVRRCADCRRGEPLPAEVAR